VSRADFERQLLEDADLRRQLGELEDRVSTARQLRESSRRAWASLKTEMRSLSIEGVPNSTLARLVGVSPQRVNSMIHEAEEAT